MRPKVIDGKISPIHCCRGMLNLAKVPKDILFGKKTANEI